MSSQKTSDKKLSKAARLMTEKPANEQFKYVAAVLEQVQGQVKAVAESLDLTRTELNQKIDDTEKSLRQEMNYMQMAIRGHSQEIKSLQQETKILQQDIKSLDQKIDGVEQRLSNKIDRVAEKVERHDEDIVFLKTAIAKA